MAFGINERLALLITADGQGAVRELEKVGKTADRELNKVEGSTERLAAQLTRAGAAFLTFGGIAAVGLFQAARAASDLGEAVNLTESIFGDAADEIGRFAEQAAAIGQSERAAREATASIGGLLQNLGFARDETVKWSIDLTTLASDLGSAFNKDPADAVLAIGAALRGETEPIRQFNVMLDDATVRAKAVEMGLADTTAEVDRHGKAQATLALIMEQTNAVQGDFAKTADSAANAGRTLAANWENLQAKLGEAALPLLEDAIGLLNAMSTGFMALDDATGGWASTLAVVATGATLAIGALSTMSGWVIKLKQNTDALKASNMSGAIGKWGPIASTAGLALGGLALSIHALGQKSRETQQQVDGLSDSIRETGDVSQSLLDHINGVVAGNGVLAQAMEIAGISTDELRVAVEQGGDSLQEMKARLWEAGETIYGRNGATAIDIMVKEVDRMASVFERGSAKAETLGTVVDDTATTAADAAPKILLVSAAAEMSATDVARYTDVLAANAAALEADARAAEVAEAALHGYLDAVVAALDSNVGYQQQLIRTEEVLETMAATLKTAEVGTRDWERALLDGESAALDQAAAAVRLAEDTAKANGQTLTAQERQRILVSELARVAATLDPSSPLSQRLNAYIRDLLTVPAGVHTNLTVSSTASEEQIRRYNLNLQNIPRSITTTLLTRDHRITPQQGAVLFPTGGMVTARSGPQIHPDGHVAVGALPGEIILNAAQQTNLVGQLFAPKSPGSPGGGDVHNHFHFPGGIVASPRQFRDMVLDAVRTTDRNQGGVPIGTRG